MPEGTAGDGSIIWLHDCVDRTDSVGAKAAELGRMAAAGLPVPQGFVVPQDVFLSHLRTSGLGEAITGRLGSTESGSEGAAAAEIGTWFKRVDLAPATAEAITFAYARLAEGGPGGDVPVAVRSSASEEDLADASFAGQQDTCLNVRAPQALLDAVRRCWASVFSERVLAYRRRTGFPLADVAISVLVQRMVDARVSGVMFTADPVTGNRLRMLVEANWGLCETVVQGDVTPDRFTLDKLDGSCESRELGSKGRTAVPLADGGVATVAASPTTADAFCLDDEELAVLVALARRIESHYGAPRDLEWSFERGLPASEGVRLLQVRPITTLPPARWTSGRPDSPTDTVINFLVDRLQADSQENG